MKRLIFAALVVLFFIHAGTANAASDPLAVPNNRFGIHILEQADILPASALVNSNGGQWGYVTLVIRQDDRNNKKWQGIFDDLRRERLIPIVRLATSSKGGSWEKPKREEISDWVSFLNSLNWVIKNRYVVLFNEPNHAKEWEDSLRPEEYAQIAREFAEKLRESSHDFFILPAGMDMSATNTKNTMDATIYWKKMYEFDRDIFTIFDGWTSHSYPNPDFSGDPADKGRKSIMGFEDEIKYLSPLGLKSNIPIFITETGWVHREGRDNWPNAPEASKLSDYFKKAFEEVWRDNRIVAITPFVLNYTSAPFDHFSWRRDTGEFYSFYETVQKIAKTNGAPVIENKGEIVADSLPKTLITDSIYDIDVTVVNKGQTIWYEGDITATVGATGNFDEILVSPLAYLEPGKEGKLTIHVRTKSSIKSQKLTVKLFYKGNSLTEPLTSEVNFVPPTALRLSARLIPKAAGPTSSDFDLVIYQGTRVIKKLEKVQFQNGSARVSEIHDLVPGQKYRFVLLTPYYLPVQMYQTLEKEETHINFEAMKPLDFNLDGTFSLSDLGAALRHPLQSFRRLTPW